MSDYTASLNNPEMCCKAAPTLSNMKMSNLSKQTAGLTPRVNKREVVAGPQGSAYCKTENRLGFEYQTDLTLNNRFSLLSQEDEPEMVDECLCDSKLHTQDCREIRELSDDRLFINLYDEHRIEPIRNDDPDAEVFSSTFFYEGVGRIPFGVDGCWWRFVGTNIAFNYPFVESQFWDQQYIEYNYSPSVQEAHRFMEQVSHSHLQKELKKIAKAKRQEDLAFLNDAFQQNCEMEKEMRRMRDYDRVRGRVFQERCVVPKCERVVVCEHQQKCLVHLNTRQCGCVEPAIQQQARDDRTISPVRPIMVAKRRIKRRWTGQAQSLFGVDIGPIDVSHVLKIPLVDDLVRELTKLNCEVPWPKIVAECGFFLYHLQKGGWDVPNVIVCGSQLAINTGLVNKLDWRALAERLPNAQSGGTMAGLSLACTGVMSLLVLLLTSKLPDDKSIDRLISRFGQLGRCIVSCEKLAQYSEQISGWLIDFVKSNFFGYSSEDLNEWKQIDALCDEIVALNTSDFEKNCVNDLQMGAKITELIQRADTVQKYLDGMKIHPSSYARFTKCALFLQRAREICSNVSAGSMRPRIAPLVIHIHGATGVGKSSMLDYLNTHLLIALGSTNPDDLQNKVYYRYPTSDFFDGFRNGTDIVVCDDFGSAKDSESNPSSEPLEQIRMTNTAPFRPPMAHLNDKANAVFEAKVIIWTSNRPTFSFPSLTNPEAVHNRVHLRFEQLVNPIFAKTKNINGKDTVCLDGEKVAAYAKDHPNAWRDCMRFRRQVVEGKPRADGSYETIGELMNFDDLVEVCVKALKNKQGMGTEMLHEQRSYFEQVLAGKAQSNFYTPGWFGQRVGLLTHINLWETMVEMADPYKFEGLTQSLMPVGARRQVAFLLRESGLPHCIAVEPDKEQEVVRVLHKLLFESVHDGAVSDTLQELAAIGYFCDEHVDYQNEATFWERIQQLRNRLSTVTVEAGLTLATKVLASPFLTGLCCGLIYAGIMALVEWILGKFSTQGPSEAYVSGQRQVHGQVEAYSSGVRAVRNNVEAYSHNIRSQPSGHIENNGHTESITDSNASEVRRKAYHNTYLLSGRKDDEWVHFGTFTIITGRVGITNRHISWSCKECVELKLSSSNGQEYKFPASEMNWAFVPDTDAVHGHRDVAIAELPRMVHLHSDITQLFMTAEDFSQHTELDKVCLLAHRLIGNDPRLIFIESNVCRAWQRDVFNVRASQSTLQVREFYSYAMETTYGDCGGLLIAFDKRFSRKVIGIHMAGVDAAKTYSGAGCAVTQEMLKKLFSHLKLRWSHSIINNTIPVDNPIEVNAENGELGFQSRLDGNFVNLGHAHTRVFAARTTAITPSPVAEICGPILKKPAYLCRGLNASGEEIDPVAKALQKAKTPAVCVDVSALAAATNHVDQMINSCIREGDNSPLTLAQAICGKEGNEFFPPINRSTSPGYGWKKVGKGKTFWLGTSEYILDHKDLLDAYNAAVARLDRGERACGYWTDTMKDELRPIEKVEQGKTRLFSAGEMILTILLRQHYMGFAAHMARNKIDVESCVGINPYGMDWNVLAMKLRSKGKHVVAGDFANYDGTLPADVLWSVFEIVDKFYRLSDEDTPRMQAHRKLLWCEIVNSVHINGQDVYMWNHSQPSGCPFTSVLNSVVHSIIVRVVYILAARTHQPQLQSLNNFDMYVSHINYGDDDVTNISDTIIDWFNQETMAEYYQHLGMTYTDELKSGKLCKSKKLSEIQFLKRAFRWDEQQARFRAPLELQTIMEMPCWNKTRGDKFALTALVLEDAVRELAQHSRAVWDQNFPKLERARLFIYPRVPLRFPSYEELQFEDVAKYFGYGVVRQNSLIGASHLSPSNAMQQNLHESECGLYGYPQSGWEGYLAPLACVCPTESIGYTPGVQTHQFELAGKAQSGRVRERQLTDFEQTVNLVTENSKNPNFAGANSEVQQQELVSFHQDGSVLAEAPVTTAVQPILEDGAHDDLANSVIGFLRRPVQLGNFDWQTSTATSAHLVTLQLPHDWLALRMIQEKVAGFKYLRCDLIVEVQINAQPFNAGMGVLWFEPLGQQQLYAPSNTAHLGGITGYPCAYYRCGDATSVQLRIPYQATQSHFDLTKACGTMGTVRFTVMSALTGSADVDGTVWAWADNVSIQMPTGLSMRIGTTVLSGVAQSGDQEQEQTEEKWRKLDLTKNERTTRGPVETVMRVAAGIATATSFIPGLQAVAGVGAATFAAGAAISSYFGWSNPINSQITDHFRPMFGKHMTNATGGSDAKVLALDARNTADIPLEVFGTVDDEMAFGNLLARPTYMDRFMFDQTAAQGFMLWKWPVHPEACVKRHVTRVLPLVSYTQFQPSLLSYVTWSARKWRGSIKYHLRAVKTPFHSGRIRLVFVPGATEQTDVTTIDISKCYSAVYDLREQSDIEFEVPFVSNTPFRNTFDGPLPNVGNTALTFGTPTGMIYVFVVNALRNPSTASNTIEFLAFVSAGSDFQLAYPAVNSRLRIVTQAANVANFAFSGEAQSGFIKATSNATPFEANGVAVGEVYTGFRQWLKRYVPTPEETNSFGDTGVSTHLFPLSMSNGQSLENDLTTVPRPLDYASCLYRYLSGPMRVLVNNLVSNKGFKANHLFRDGVVAPGDGDGTPRTINTYAEPITEFEVPLYTHIAAMATRVGAPIIATGYDLETNFYRTTANTTGGFLYTQRDPGQLEYQLAFGEVTSLGLQIGPPILVMPDLP